MDVAGSNSWKAGVSKKKEKMHQEVVQGFCNKPELLGIVNVLYKKLSPKNKEGKEVGDIIFVTTENIFIVEVTFGGSKKLRKDSFKLKRSRNFFSSTQNKASFLKRLGITSSHHTVKGIIASYEGRWIHEGPQIIEDFTLKDA